MKRGLFAAASLACLLAAASAHADPFTWTKPYPYQSAGSCAAIPSLATASPVMSTIPSGAKSIDFQIIGGNVLYRDDGTAPTSTVGIILGPNPLGPPYTILLSTMANFQMLQQGATVTGFACAHS